MWDLPSGTPRYVLPAVGASVYALAFSPDAKSLLTAAAAAQGDGDIKVWEAETGKPAGALKGHTSGLFEVSFRPDGKALVSAGWDGTVRVWDFAARRETRVIPSPEGRWIRSVVVSAGGPRTHAVGTPCARRTHGPLSLGPRPSLIHEPAAGV